MKKTWIIFLFLCLFCPYVYAYSESFVIQAIQIEGLQRISRGTVLNYMPVKVGQTLTAVDTTSIVRELYGTGFFSNVHLSRKGNTLVVWVTERPVVSDISISGNHAFTRKKILEAFKSVGIAPGMVFDQATLDSAVKDLQSQYYNEGKYSAKVKAEVSDLSRQRVSIHLNITEGTAAKIREIRIIGNKTFTEHKLLKQFKLTTPGIMTIFNHNDQYSKVKLDADLESLRSYYMDRGFIKFKVDSTQVSLTPDRHDVFIAIKVTEGPRYYIKDFRFAGNLILPKEDLAKLITIKPNDVFSRKKVLEGTTAISQALGNEGYAFAKVDIAPTFDEKEKTVLVTYVVNPGRKTYIRRINFSGNNKTSDVALRRVLRQMEGAMFSLKNIQESSRKLRLLGYLKDVQVETPPVPGTNNQVDLDFKVKENPGAAATFQIGYSTDGMVLGAGINQPNFLGTGNSLNIQFNHQVWVTSYKVTYLNPFYTENGVSRSFDVYYNRYDPSDLGLVSYSTDNYGGSVGYGIPLSENNTFNFNVGLERSNINVGSTPATEISTYLNEAGTNNFNQLWVSGSFIYQGLDKAIFPTKGYYQVVSGLVALPTGGEDSLEYYKLNYNGYAYYPLVKNFIITSRLGLGYGNSYGGSVQGLPFFKNFFEGGLTTVRGYDTNSLGPKDSNFKPYGGDVAIDGSLALIFPTPIPTDVVRTSFFVDAGNVYNVNSAINPTTGSGPVRLSTGVEVQWRSPFGPLKFAVATPLNRQQGDTARVFDFGASAGFF